MSIRVSPSSNQEIKFKVIGYIESWYKTKNGTPHQPTVCAESKAKLEIAKSVFTNPHHSLDGLKDFSHVWIFFHFHKNQSKFVKAKVAPPRLNGRRIGVFGTRSPHRPNALGMTLACLDEVKGSTLHLSGIDILDGTPVIDIKPYIPLYDSPFLKRAGDKIIDAENYMPDAKLACQLEEAPVNETVSTNSSCVEDDGVRISNWISKPPIQALTVRFTVSAEEQLAALSSKIEDGSFHLSFLTSVDKARKSIIDILSADPRSIYRRNDCKDRLYYFTVDKIHVTCWFDDDENVAEVLKLKTI